MKNNNLNIQEKSTNKKVNKKLIVIAVLLIITIILCIIFMLMEIKKNNSTKIEPNKINYSSKYQLSSNSLEDFDLYFLKLEDEKENKIYSPLSIKYALEMLEEGANGETKKQITNIVGTYQAKKYINSNNLSLANSLFIKEEHQDSINKKYIDTLKNKYDAEIIFDDFKKPDNINNWISKKTFKLINNLFDDVSTSDFIIANALAINMNWKKEIQNINENCNLCYDHEKINKHIPAFTLQGYNKLDFDNKTQKVNSVEFAATVNKYDIVKKLGEDNIRKEVATAYNKFLKELNGLEESAEDTDSYIDEYIEELKANYNKVNSSTDFSFYNDDNIKVFAKDLRKYNDTQLQYIGIMPKKEKLNNYIENVNAQDIGSIINKLSTVETGDFKEDVVTLITGNIPMFEFDYELKLKDDLNKLGINNVFDIKTADLTKLSSDNAYISDVKHKSNITFSNEGIKASAVTAMPGGIGGAEMSFIYDFDVPVETIDLTFNNPYLFLIRDKDTGEVWFIGTVYNPTEYKN